MNKNIKLILINLAAVALVAVLAVWGVNKWMLSYTHHGENFEVPELTGVRLDKAIEIIEEGNFRYEITDSVYRDSFKKMDIVEQDPVAGSMVKKGRKIYIIVNSLDKPKVKVPMLTDKSLNLAKALIKNAGLRLGTVETKKTTLGNNLVLAQLIKGDTVRANTMVYRDTRIDLIVSVRPDEDDEFDEEGNLIIREDDFLDLPDFE